MSCNCLKNVANEFDRALELAKYESKIDKKVQGKAMC